MDKKNIREFYEQIDKELASLSDRDKLNLLQATLLLINNFSETDVLKCLAEVKTSVFKPRRKVSCANI